MNRSLFLRVRGPFGAASLFAHERQVIMAITTFRPKTLVRRHDQLCQGCEPYRRRAWGNAFQWLSLADQASALEVDDLERLATAVYLTGQCSERDRDH